MPTAAFADSAASSVRPKLATAASERQEKLKRTALLNTLHDLLGNRLVYCLHGILCALDGTFVTQRNRGAEEAELSCSGLTKHCELRFCNWYRLGDGFAR